MSEILMSDDNRPFPIQGGTYRDKETKDYLRPIKHYQLCIIPWWLAEEAYEHYSKLYGSSQSLERLAERGGFDREELLWLLRHETN
jgi:hypothetical protein